MIYFERRPIDEPQFYQDHRSAILISKRLTLIYNTEGNEWIRVTDCCEPQALWRSGTSMHDLTFREWLKIVGWRGLLEALGARLGTTRIGRILDFFMPPDDMLDDLEPPRIEGGGYVSPASQRPRPRS